MRIKKQRPNKGDDWDPIWSQFLLVDPMSHIENGEIYNTGYAASVLYVCKICHCRWQGPWVGVDLTYWVIFPLIHRIRKRSPLRKWGSVIHTYSIPNSQADDKVAIPSKPEIGHSTRCKGMLLTTKNRHLIHCRPVHSFWISILRVKIL